MGAPRRTTAAQQLNGLTHYLARLESAGMTNERSHQMTDDRLLDVREEPPIHALIFETFDAGDVSTGSDPEQAHAEGLAAEGGEKTRSMIVADKAEKREAASGRARLRRELAQVLADATVDDIARIIAHDPARARGLKNALTFYENSRPCPSCGWGGRPHAGGAGRGGRALPAGRPARRLQSRSGRASLPLHARDRRASAPELPGLL